MWRVLEKQPGVNIRVSIHIYREKSILFTTLDEDWVVVHFNIIWGRSKGRVLCCINWSYWFLRAGRWIVFVCTIAVLIAFISGTMNSLWIAGHMVWISNSWGLFILIVLHSNNVFYDIVPGHTPVCLHSHGDSPLFALVKQAWIFSLSFESAFVQDCNCELVRIRPTTH